MGLQATFPGPLGIPPPFVRILPALRFLMEHGSMSPPPHRRPYPGESTIKKPPPVCFLARSFPTQLVRPSPVEGKKPHPDFSQSTYSSSHPKEYSRQSDQMFLSRGRTSLSTFPRVVTPLFPLFYRTWYYSLAPKR